MKITCIHCHGTGKVEHVCDEKHFLLLKILKRLAQGNFYNSIGIYQCSLCGKLYKQKYSSEYAFGKIVENYPEGSKEFPKKEVKEYQEYKRKFPKSVI